jgi:hypothetical protein
MTMDALTDFFRIHISLVDINNDCRRRVGRVHKFVEVFELLWVH